jgi:hypothetical protein
MKLIDIAEFKNILNLDVLLVSNGFSLQDINGMTYLDYESYVSIIHNKMKKRSEE